MTKILFSDVYVDRLGAMCCKRNKFRAKSENLKIGPFESEMAHAPLALHVFRISRPAI
jgi:hypothetical protein